MPPQALFRRGQAHLLRSNHINGLALALEARRSTLPPALRPASSGHPQNPMHGTQLAARAAFVVCAS